MDRASAQHPVGGSGPAPASPRDAGAVLDAAYAACLDAHPEPPGGSLLAQTILTGAARRALLQLIELRPGCDVLDLGTGFGPVVLELAHRSNVRGVGVDRDPEVLALATTIAGSLEHLLHPGASVRFEQGEVTALPFEAGTFDLATARLLFQHLPDPRGAVRELWRVLRPSGKVIVVDVDDGFGLTYPAASPELQALEHAFAKCQASQGGDREIGRKLSTYFSEGGFRIDSVRVLGSAQHLASEQGDASRVLNASRLRNLREEIVARGLLEAGEFDRLLVAYEQELPVQRFRAECQVVLVAEKP